MSEYTYTIAVDFDGTLCSNAFPKVGEPKWDVINKVKKLKEEGWELILWTCRSGKALDDAVKATQDWGIKWDSINDHTPSQKKWWNGDFGTKVFANYYLDDRSLTIDQFLS